MMFRPLGNGESVDFGMALSHGQAPDGSLYFPRTIPTISEDTIADLDICNRQEAAEMVLDPWLWDELTHEELLGVIGLASTFETPVVDVADKKVLELFHGPTQAFKDVAARYLAGLMGHYNRTEDRTSTVLVATSGDTGGAIAHGFADVEGTQVVVLYPKGKVSAMQQEQLRRTAGNVHTLEVDGVFDDCQELVKQAMSDVNLRRINPTSANSISVGRLIPQITYYAGAVAQLGQEQSHRFVVPTGNLGNLTAGILAHRMGIPIHSFLAANNRNDALFRYLNSGEYVPTQTIETMSNAMDVGRPNNFPRFHELFGGDVVTARRLVRSAMVDDETTIATIKQVYEEHGYVLDPHTAVAWAASEQVPNRRKRDDITDVIVSTASPAKFSEEIEATTGIKVDNAAELAELRKKPESFDEIPVSYQMLKGYLLARFK